MKKSITISIIISIITTITFLVLTLSQINFFNSFSLLLLSLSISVSLLSIKLLEGLKRIKIVLLITILLNSIIGISLFSKGILRQYEWLPFIPLVILVSLALSQSIKNQDKLNTFTAFGISFSTFLIAIPMVLIVESSLYYITTFTLLSLSSIAFFIVLFKHK